MSAIAAIFTTNGSEAAVDKLFELTALGSHRGHGQVSTKILGRVGLGITFRRVTPEDLLEDQPVDFERERLWAVFDGRFDNRNELLRTLGLAHDDCVSDCRLAMLGYKRWGKECAQHMIGAFVFIIWDGAREQLFLAIDHLGSRPLFFANNGRQIAFASTIRQLLRDQTISRELDDTYFLSTLCLPSAGPLWSTRTPYKHISRLLPGHTITVSKDGAMSTLRYWHPENLQVDRDMSYVEATRRIRATFFNVVESHLRTSKNILTTLSGGLDSSSITCTALQLASKGRAAHKVIRPCSLVYPENLEADERKYQQCVVEAYNSPTFEMRGDQTYHFHGLFTDAPYADEPFGAYVALHEVKRFAHAAQELDCNVVLFGIGGDELLTGSKFGLAELLLQGDVGGLIKGVRAQAHLRNMNYFSTFLKYSLLPLMPQALVRKRIDARRRWDDQTEFLQFTVPPWLSIDKRLSLQILHEVWNKLPERWSSVPAISEQLARIRENMCIAWKDTYALMPAGSEARYPFLDRRFIEVALTIPESYKWRVEDDGSITAKLVLREALQDVLPEQIRLRQDKSSFNSQFSLGLYREWYQIVRDEPFEIVKRGYIAQERLIHYLNLWRLGQWDFLGQLINLLVTEIWFRRQDAMLSEIDSLPLCTGLSNQDTKKGGDSHGS